MILGGMIWITIVSLIPEGLLNNLNINIFSIIWISLISFLLPVPMFFDIIFSGIAYNSSISNIFAVILLLNLWGFSIYPILVLKQNIRLKKIILFSIIFIISSSIAAVFIHHLEEYLNNNNNNNNKEDIFFSQTWKRNLKYMNEINNLSPQEIDDFFNVHRKRGENDTQEVKEIKFQTWSVNWLEYSSFKFEEEENEWNTFTVLYWEELWIKQLWYRLNHMYSWIWISDYNDDWWEDIILPSANGLNIYKNIGGEFIIDWSFSLWDTINNSEISQANFYDIDGDGLKDLVTVTRTTWVYIIWNNNGVFDIKDSLNFDTTLDENYSYGMSIGDIYDDGNIDIFIGEFSAVNRDTSLQNFIIKNLWNRKMEIIQMQKGTLGATLTGLIWDFDNDGKNEIFEGNDFAYASDIIYDVDWNDNIYFHEKMKDILPETPYSQMGFTIGDINNDLIPEYFLSGSEPRNTKNLDESQKVKDVYITACEFPWNNNLEKMKEKELICELKELILTSAIRNECWDIQNKYIKTLCTTLYKSGSRNSFQDSHSQEYFCESIKNSFHFSVFYEYCKWKDILKLRDTWNPKEIIPQVNNNVLIMNGENIVNSIEDLSSWWSWWAFFADLDNNWFQDLYVWNWHMHNNQEKESNKLLMNYWGVMVPKEWNLWTENYIDTLTSSYIDYDNDGDLDIINTSIFWDIIFYRNDIPNRNSIILDLVDTTSNNTEAIWSKVIITTSDGKKQMRYIYVGWHFLSLQNTQVHFWINDHTFIKKIEIMWPDQSKSIITQELHWNHKYLIKKY